MNVQKEGTVMRCPHCNSRLKANNKFCPECGLTVTRENEVDSKRSGANRHGTLLMMVLVLVAVIFAVPKDTAFTFPVESTVATLVLLLFHIIALFVVLLGFIVAVNFFQFCNAGTAYHPIVCKDIHISAFFCFII